jgi:hypothetical protein
MSQESPVKPRWHSHFLNVLLHLPWPHIFVSGGLGQYCSLQSGPSYPSLHTHRWAFASQMPFAPEQFLGQ